jgi:hypothetical protein
MEVFRVVFDEATTTSFNFFTSLANGYRAEVDPLLLSCYS